MAIGRKFLNCTLIFEQFCPILEISYQISFLRQSEEMTIFRIWDIFFIDILYLLVFIIVSRDSSRFPRLQFNKIYNSWNRQICVSNISYHTGRRKANNTVLLDRLLHFINSKMIKLYILKHLFFCFNIMFVNNQNIWISAYIYMLLWKLN